MTLARGERVQLGCIMVSLWWILRRCLKVFVQPGGANDPKPSFLCKAGTGSRVQTSCHWGGPFFKWRLFRFLTSSLTSCCQHQRGWRGVDHPRSARHLFDSTVWLAEAITKVESGTASAVGTFGGASAGGTTGAPAGGRVGAAGLCAVAALQTARHHQPGDGDSGGTAAVGGLTAFVVVCILGFLLVARSLNTGLHSVWRCKLNRLMRGTNGYIKSIDMLVYSLALV